MLVMPKDVLPILVNVTACAALVVPTDWLPNVMLGELSEKPTVDGEFAVDAELAVDTEAGAVLALPPQDAENKAMAMQAVARINAVPRPYPIAAVSKPNSLIALVLPRSGRIPSLRRISGCWKDWIPGADLSLRHSRCLCSSIGSRYAAIPVLGMLRRLCLGIVLCLERSRCGEIES